jgi:hypothetical protein
MTKRHHRPDDRRIAIAKLTGVAARYASRTSTSPISGDALAELAGISTDPDVLAEAAATYADGDHWYGDAAVDLLTAAGADPVAIAAHVQRRRSAPRGFDLARFANGANKAP